MKKKAKQIESVHNPDFDLKFISSDENSVDVSVIYFYADKAEHGYMSNFARYPIKIDGKNYKTSEH